MYNLIEHIYNFSKTSGTLWKFYRDEPNDNLTDFELFKSKIKITGKTPNNGNTKVDCTIIVPLKYLRNVWRTLEWLLINLTWSLTCIITNSRGAKTFTITDTKRYVPIVTLWTQHDAELLQHLKSGFKRTVNWKKYQLNTETFTQSRHLNSLVDPRFQGLNRLFVLLSQNENDRTSHWILSFRSKNKNYPVKIDSKNPLDQLINNDTNTYENRKIAVGWGDDYTTGCLLDYPYFKKTAKCLQ